MGDSRSLNQNCKFTVGDEFCGRERGHLGEHILYKKLMADPSPTVVGERDVTAGQVARVYEEVTSYELSDLDADAIANKINASGIGAGHAASLARLTVDQVSQIIAARRLLPYPPGDFDIEGITKELNKVLVGEE